MDIAPINPTANRLATIDVGTNTVLLLVADVWPDGRVTTVYEEQRFARLGEGVDASRTLLPVAMKRVRDALLAYKSIGDVLGVQAIRVGGTSACRDAVNQAVLRDYLLKETGLYIEVLTGDEEAILAFQGATSFTDQVAGAVLVMDIGGGSTELVLGDATSGELHFRHSFDVGSVRMRERCFHQIPPSSKELETADQWLSACWHTLPFSVNAEQPTFILASGAGMALGLMEAGALAFDRKYMTRKILGHQVVSAWFERLLHTAPESLLALNPAVMHGRSDVFVASIQILHHFMQYFGLPEVYISGGEWRHGWLRKWGQSLFSEPERPSTV
ncbi:MAG: hypothetical protein JNN12_02960 [Bacteroidetes Order II. Incertae sedis bacterium]|nr:hypothetical protein [Bacteroidetes Order II. bacterium]